MQEIQYSTNTWHYRIVTSHYMLVPNIFNYHQEYDPDKNCYKIIAPTDFCLYWRIVFEYCLIQIPLIILAGSIIFGTFVMCPLFSLIIMIQFSISEVFNTSNIMVSIGTMLNIVYFLTLLSLITLNYTKVTQIIPFRYISSVISDVSEVYDSFRSKYCKKINFKQED